MTRQPRRYAVSLHLVGGQTEQVHFSTLDQFQQWYQGGISGGAPRCGDRSAGGTSIRVPR